MRFLSFLTFFLLRRSHVKRSPHGTYSMTRNIFSSSVQHPTIDTTFLCEPNIFICSISNVNSSFCVSDGSSKDNWIKWFCLLPVVWWQHWIVNSVLDFSFAWQIFIPFYCTHSHLICTKGQVHFTLVIAFQFNIHVTTPSFLITASDGITGTVRVGAASYLEPLPYLPYLRP